MKLRRWVWIVGGLCLAVFGLVLLSNVSDKSNQRRLEAELAQSPRRGRAGAAFGPREIWAAATPFDGLGAAFRVNPEASRGVVQRSVGIDLVEAEAPVPPQPHAGSTRKLIRTGQVRLEVSNFDEASGALTLLAQGLGGYVAGSKVEQLPNGGREGWVLLRLPADRYEAAGGSVRQLGRQLSAETSVQDVTKAYADLETRLKVKRASVEKIRELLRTRAGSLKDVLEAEKEMGRLTEEIEKTEGERRAMAHDVLFSTLRVELEEPGRVVALGPSAWASLKGTFRDGGGILSDSLAFMLRFVLVFLPWVSVGVGVGFLVRWLRRRRAAVAPEA